MRAVRRWAWPIFLTGLTGLLGCDDGDPGGAGGAGGAGGTDGEVAGEGGIGGGAGGSDMGGVGGVGGGEGGVGGAPPMTCLGDEDCPDAQWCAPTADFEGQCAPGCRPEAPGLACGEREICNANTRACERDPRCLDDTECLDAQTWCDDGECVAGCRPDPDNCLPDEEGRAQLCDAATRTCARIVACCDGGACTAVIGSSCDTVIDGFFSCTLPNLCDRVCARDSNCEEAEYCAENGLCEPGCRLEDDESCVGQVCEAESRACVPKACAADRECRPNQFCAPQGCLVGCRADPDNCGDDMECGANRQCVGSDRCRNDDQCVRELGEGFRCIDEACRAFCDDDAQCQSGEYCAFETGICVEGCRDDALEPDDSRNEATLVELAAGPWESPEDAIACPLDRDWYRFELGAGGGVQVELDFRHAAGDLDMRLHPPVGPAIVVSTQDNDEIAEAFSADAGVWYVEVFARGLATNTYRLAIAPIHPGGCGPDEAELEGDDAPRDATVIATDGLEDLIVINDRTACAGDVDWFRVGMGNDDGMHIELVAAGEGMALPLDFEIYGPGLPPPDAMPTFLPNGGDLQTLRFTAPRPTPQIDAGDYYIKVFSVGEMGGAVYDLRVSVDRNRALCQIDVGEPNDDGLRPYDLMRLDDFTRPAFGGGRELQPDVDLDIEDLWLCAGEEDWFSFEARTGDDFSISVVRHDNEIVGDVQIEVINAAGDAVGLPGRNAAALNVARVDTLAAARYRVRISAAAENTQTQYTLRVQRTAGPVECPPDRLEAGGNERREDAALVPLGETAGLTLCGDDADTDWYAYRLDDVADLTISARFAHAQANLDIDVFRDDALQPENANSPMGHGQDDNELVVLPNRLPGLYLIRVRAVDGGNAQYSISVSTEARDFVCQDDPDEPNEVIGESTMLGREPVERVDQWLCDRVPAEADVFAIDVPGGQGRTITSTFTFGDDGDLVLDVIDANGVQIATTSGVPRELSKQCMRVPSYIADRRLFVRVRPLAINRILDDDERLDYDLRVLAGDDACETVAPATPGVMWPLVPQPAD